MVLIAAGECADKYGLFAVPVAILAQLAKVRPRQVQYDLNTLCDRGELVKESGGKGGRGVLTIYRITLPTFAPFPNIKRVQSMKGVLQTETVPTFAPITSRARAHLKEESTNNRQETGSEHHEEPSPYR